MDQQTAILRTQAAPPQTEKATAKAWLGLFVLVLMYVASYMDRQIISLMVEPLKRDLHLSEMQFGLLQGAAFATFYALVGFPMGWMVDRFSRRAIIFSGMVVWSMACAACGLAASAGQFMVGRFALGAGEAVLAPAGMATLGDSFPKTRISLAVNIFKGGALIGGVASVALGGVLLAWANGHGPVQVPVFGVLQPWQQVLTLIGLPGVAAAFLAFLLPRGARSAGPRAPAAPFLPYLRRRKAYVATVLFGGALLVIPSFAGQAWGAAYLIRHYHLPVDKVGGIMAITALGPALGFLFHGWITDRMFARGIRAAHLLPGLWSIPLIAALAYFAYVRVDDLKLFVALSFAIQFLLTSASTIDGHIQLTSPSAYRGRMAALYGMGQHLLAISIGPALVAFFTEEVFGDPKYVGWGLAATYALVAPLAMVVVSLGLRSARRAADEALEGVAAKG
jgi:MFS family permease